MAWGTDILLLLSLDETCVEDDEELREIESEALTQVNGWLNKNGYGQLINLSDHAFKAGNRAMLALVFGGAFNRLDDEVFVEIVAKQNWLSRPNVQLFIKCEGEERFKFVDIGQHKLET